MISLKNISKVYEKTVIKNLSLDFKEGEITALLGSSGAGKTTLMNILIGIDKDFVGNIEGMEGEKVSVVFQEDRLLEDFSVLENLRVVNPNEEECLRYGKEIGIDGFLKKQITHLSGGMKRRVALARAFAYNGNIIVMDEPFKGIDISMKKNIMLNVKKLLKGKTCVFITHDVYEAVEMADRIIVFAKSPLAIYKDLDLKRKGKDVKELEKYLFETECGF